ncbi:hypothetical protein BDQ12DRAFT_692847 [Crucibulum laeve]|uniref:Uncharacterized protein n=1 Tax=Crucibulum laeve TaxID=68775 RepID=A0A5C3LJZ1_9AGAR|nr:hypothetical protein BDQ12DRAFT_692847 [Crucibulum laeve]
MSRRYCLRAQFSCQLAHQPEYFEFLWSSSYLQCTYCSLSITAPPQNMSMVFHQPTSAA